MTDETKSQGYEGSQIEANDEKVEPSRGNVFADLGFRDAEERLLKAKLATKIAELIEKKGWTKLRLPSGLAWTSPKYRISCAAALPAFQQIVYSQS